MAGSTEQSAHLDAALGLARRRIRLVRALRLAIPGGLLGSIAGLVFVGLTRVSLLDDWEAVQPPYQKLPLQVH